MSDAGLGISTVLSGLSEGILEGLKLRREERLAREKAEYKQARDQQADEFTRERLDLSERRVSAYEEGNAQQKESNLIARDTLLLKDIRETKDEISSYESLVDKYSSRPNSKQYKRAMSRLEAANESLNGMLKNRLHIKMLQRHKDQSVYLDKINPEFSDVAIRALKIKSDPNSTPEERSRELDELLSSEPYLKSDSNMVALIDDLKSQIKGTSIVPDQQQASSGVAAAESAPTEQTVAVDEEGGGETVGNPDWKPREVTKAAAAKAEFEELQNAKMPDNEYAARLAALVEKYPELEKLDKKLHATILGEIYKSLPEEERAKFSR